MMRGVHAAQMYPLVRAVAATLALAVSFPVWADFTGKVVAVADGDSITVLDRRACHAATQNAAAGWRMQRVI